MKKLTRETIITDRVNATVWLHQNDYTDNSGGTFILARDAVLRTPTSHVSGTFAAYTTELLELSGQFVAIDMLGVNFAGTKIHEVNASLPGDLSYIDGCSNSNLIAPPRNGDPCSNYLFFPPHITQTRHTHPSFRLGLVLEGCGTAHLPDGELALMPGDVFYLPRFLRHGFSTKEQSMSLMVFHPDSDDGPTDEHNPMKRRTYL